MKIRDFSLDMYEEICKALKLYNVVTVEQYILEKCTTPFIVLRHDVDREHMNALAMAELEHRYGIKSTYYFRYPPKGKVISAISNLGHEIGYHYEVLDKAQGDYQKALEIFQQELADFRGYFPVKTICMHGNPLTKWDGRDLWKSYDYKKFDLLGEAYLSCTDLSIYLTDTGRNWGGDSNVKDKFSVHSGDLSLKKTTELIDYLNSNQLKSIYLNCHPERWGPGFGAWIRALTRDKFFNLCKRFIQRFYSIG